MKRTIFALIALTMFASCATTRKTNKDLKESVLDSTQINSEKTESSTTFVDTTRTTTGEVIITEIEFFTPGSVNADSTGVQVGNTGGIISDVEISGGIIKNAGAVKSIKQTKIQSHEERNGKTEETNMKKDVENKASLTRKEKEEHKATEPTADPYRWRYIAFIVSALLAVLVVLYLKSQPIFRCLKNFFARIREFFE